MTIYASTVDILQMQEVCSGVIITGTLNYNNSVYKVYIHTINYCAESRAVFVRV